MRTYLLSNKDKLRELTGLACIGHLDKLPDTPKHLDTQRLKGDKHGLEGWALFDGSHILIIFSGVEPGDYRDWLLLLKRDFIELPYLPGKGAHGGFVSAYRAVQEDVLNFITKHQNFHNSVPILFMGHSMGGALAEIAMSHMAYPNMQSFTVGAPPVFDKKTARAFMDRNQRRSVRLLHTCDLVTRLDTFVKDLNHASPALFIDDSSRLSPNKPGWLDWVRWFFNRKRNYKSPWTLVVHSRASYTKLIRSA